MKYIALMFLFGIGLLCSPVYAQPKTLTLTGKLVKKPWSKTLESYCAQGSDYFVLVRPKKKDVLLSLSESDAPMFETWLRKKVQVKGEWVTTTIPPNPNSQHPVTPSLPNGAVSEGVQCRLFHISNLRLLGVK